METPTNAGTGTDTETVTPEDEASSESIVGHLAAAIEGLATRVVHVSENDHLNVQDHLAAAKHLDAGNNDAAKEAVQRIEDRTPQV